MIKNLRNIQFSRFRGYSAGDNIVADRIFAPQNSGPVSAGCQGLRVPLAQGVSVFLYGGGAQKVIFVF